MHNYNFLLHWEPHSDSFVSGGGTTVSDSNVDASRTNSKTMVCVAHAKGQPSTHEEGQAILNVLPVKVWASNPEKYILIYTLLDEGRI